MRSGMSRLALGLTPVEEAAELAHGQPRQDRAALGRAVGAVRLAHTGYVGRRVHFEVDLFLAAHGRRMRHVVALVRLDATLQARALHGQRARAHELDFQLLAGGLEQAGQEALGILVLDRRGHDFEQSLVVGHPPAAVGDVREQRDVRRPAHGVEDHTLLGAAGDALHHGLPLSLRAGVPAPESSIRPARRPARSLGPAGARRRRPAPPPRSRRAARGRTRRAARC